MSLICPICKQNDRFIAIFYCVYSILYDLFLLCNIKN